MRFRLMVRLFGLTLVLAVGLGCSVGSLIARAPTYTPTVTKTPRPTFTATPNWTATPTNTSTPTNTPIPTATPIPSATPTPLPTDTPLPTKTPRPKPPTATPTPAPPTDTPTPAYEFALGENEVAPFCSGNNFAILEIRLSTADDTLPVLGYKVQARNLNAGQVLTSEPSGEMGESAPGQGWNHRINLKFDVLTGYDGTTWEFFVINAAGQQTSPSYKWALDANCHHPAFVRWYKQQ